MKSKLRLTLGVLMILAVSALAFQKVRPVVVQSLHQWKEVKNETLRTGDLIFQSSEYGQGKAIQLATGSPISHVGMLVQDGSSWLVFEAVQPVKMTPLKEFMKRTNNHVVIKRLRDADKALTPEVIEHMKEQMKAHLGKTYDLHFNWSDDRMYCSEVVWKLYQRAAGIEIGQPEPLSHYDLSHPEVQRQMQERYGDNIPLDEPMIAPGSMFESPLLIEVCASDC